MNRNKELFLKWLESAKNDMKYAQGNFKMGYYSQVCFLCQQSVEKTLKAFLFLHNQKLIRTHNLERLLEKALVFEKKFLNLKKNCQILNRYYTDTRYPDIWDYSRFDNKNLAKEAIDLTKELLEFVALRMKNSKG